MNPDLKIWVHSFLLIGGVQAGFIATRFGDRRFQIVGDCDFGNAAEKYLTARLD